MKYFITRFFPGFIIELFIRKISGLKNIPKGPVILAANHASFADDPLLPYITITRLKKNPRTFVNSRFYKNFFLRKYLYHYGCIPVDVGKDVKDEKKRKSTNERAFKEALNSLKKGDVVCIFPEGGRSDDGKLKKAKVGIARLALLSKVPVIPLGFIGTYEIMPKGAKFPKFRKLEIKIGKPLSFGEFYGKDKNYKALEQATTKVMREIAKLTNQKYNL